MYERIELSRRPFRFVENLIECTAAREEKEDLKLLGAEVDRAGHRRAVHDAQDDLLVGIELEQPLPLREAHFGVGEERSHLERQRRGPIGHRHGVEKRERAVAPAEELGDDVPGSGCVARFRPHDAPITKGQSSLTLGRFGVEGARMGPIAEEQQ